MDFFDNVSQMATDAAQVIKKETTRLVDNTKLVLQIKSEQMKVKGMQTEIGKLIYAQYKSGLAPFSDDIRDFCQSIDESAALIGELRRAQNKANNKRECTKCHAAMRADDSFCPKCGTEQPVGAPGCGCDDPNCCK